jgi:rhamnulokinase
LPQALSENLYIAVDLGAGSGRVFLAGFPDESLLLQELRRFHYPATRSAGHLRWNLLEIFEQIKTGIREAARQARELDWSITSIGIDGWGVDYGLINADGKLVEDPICYRDNRTEGIMEQLFAQIQREEIFARTGIQFMPFNTLFQICAHSQEGLRHDATRLLLIPDLLHFFLTGRPLTEYTNATTTQMVNAESKSWDTDMLTRLGLPVNLLTGIVPAGTEIGPIKPDLGAELGVTGVRVVAPATHDTGSAVVGAPLKEGWAYISSGTWSLVGIERDRVLANAKVSRHNFTNEGGAFGTFRFLKNVTGLWILESCRREWKDGGLDIEYSQLLHDVSSADDICGLIFPDDPRFFNPRRMLGALAEQLSETGQLVPQEPVKIARIVLDSLAFRYASVLRKIEELTGNKIKGVQIVGGGSQNDYLNQATATVTELPVLAGPVEATAIGNALVQSIVAGRFLSLADGRRHVAGSVELKSFVPQPSAKWAAARLLYEEIERRYAGENGNG